MVTCGQRNMMPMATASAVTMSSSSAVKPKIGFSIDSIVGSTSLRNDVIESSLSPRSEISERISSPVSDCSYPLELRNSTEFSRNFRFSNDYAHLDSFQSNVSSKQPDIVNFGLEKSCFEKNNRCSPVFNQSRSTVPDDPGGKHSDRPQSPRMTPSNPPINKGPIVVPGIPAGLIRPFPVQGPNIGDAKVISPFLSSRDIAGATNPHFLAAQFQMAAALAHGQSGQVFPPNSGLPSVVHHPQFVGGPNMVRDSYPLYPWLLSRHGRIFPHRFPGNFLLQPFRKPKRVRTAFSPSQLLKLEHAFENNHYVVGAERKTLAQALNLTETQVKVWFQNRRTKHKRMQQEENSKGGGSGNSDNSNSDGRKIVESNGSSRTSYEDEDHDEELIDMDDCLSDTDEGDLVPR